jgi:K(+)-stimulated pyrophosphate-energized sodium pump
MLIGAISIVASIVGTWFVRLIGKGGVMKALYQGLIAAMLVSIAGFYVLTWQFFHTDLGKFHL